MEKLSGAGRPSLMRGAGVPNIGTDNEDILQEIGLTDTQIKTFYDKKIIDRESYTERL